MPISTTKRGRPRMSRAGGRVKVSVSLKPEEFIKLEALARSTKTTNSSIIRAAVNVLYHLADLKKEGL